MKTQKGLSRRSFLELMAAAPLGAAALSAATKQIPIGLELYSVRHHLDEKELPGTLRQVRKMGYQCVEFFAPYYQWTPAYAKQVRGMLDHLGLNTYSTHNEKTSFTPEGIGKAMELNHILGTRFIVMAWPGKPKTLDEWKQVAELLNRANQTMEKHGFHAGYHNHDAEWKPVDGTKPMQVIADNTDKSIMLQLDVGTCVAAGSDPVAWVKSQPGRIKSMHLKDWSPQLGYKALFGEGVVPWKPLIAAAKSVGGAEYLLIEQEGSRYPELETARLCLKNYHKMFG
jgi:sugar phosphate isomerase/epimerase